MTSTAKQTRWRAVGGTVVGASHLRAGIPNQDAIRLPTAEDLTFIVAVSDGHGSPKCFRSDRGSRYAIAAAVLVATELLERTRGEDVTRLAERTAEWVPRELARRWREAVELDLVLSPLTVGELDALEARDGASARSFVVANPLLVYGATVLVAVVEEQFLMFAQLGDGDILVVSEAGEVTRPLPKDERLFANETTSLSSPSAERDFRVAVHALSASQPALVLLSTDGYANSFRDEAGFLKVGADLLEMIGASGLDAIARDIPTWLEDTSRMGSGDDVTLAIICRTDAIRAPAAPAAAPAGEAIPASPAAAEPTASEPAEVASATPAGNLETAAPQPAVPAPEQVADE
jgi:serine/threonine protein phosphatase PrpC